MIITIKPLHLILLPPRLLRGSKSLRVLLLLPSLPFPRLTAKQSPSLTPRTRWSPLAHPPQRIVLRTPRIRPTRALLPVASWVALSALLLSKKQQRREDENDPFASIYPPMTAAAGATAANSSSNSSNARPLVAPYRPVSKVAGVEEDPYAPYQHSNPSGPTTGYYEDYRYSDSHHPSSSEYIPGQQYYSGGVSEPEYYGGTGAGRYWPEGSSDGGDRHVPNLADERTDVPHSRS
ncbi:hypothetical protein BX666DRAFT_367072 [Dichotomocladium elegans]|nr:hypothetical protein BX666DRAFT_367072 [Dichotomocladium elegans]